MSALAREGVGLLLVTHHLDDIVPEIDRVVLLREGQIFADGAKADAADIGERLSAMFGVPVDVVRARWFLPRLVRISG